MSLMAIHAQRSAVASLIGRCEGLISRGQLSEFQAVRLLKLLNETCAAFDMAPPQIGNEEKESRI